LITSRNVIRALSIGVHSYVESKTIRFHTSRIRFNSRTVQSSKNVSRLKTSLEDCVPVSKRDERTSYIYVKSRSIGLITSRNVIRALSKGVHSYVESRTIRFNTSRIRLHCIVVQQERFFEDSVQVTKRDEKTSHLDLKTCNHLIDFQH